MDLGRIGYYAAMVTATVAAGLLYRRDQASRLPPQSRIWIAVGGVIGATFTAKLPFVFSSNSPILFWFGDGKTVLWGLAGGYLGVEVAKWTLHIETRTGDRFVIPVSVAIGIGRLGCLANGCCYGIPTNGSWGIASSAVEAGPALRHPAPLYESFFHLGFAIVAALAIRRRLLPDRWMLLYLISYCVFRFVSETWRCEPRIGLGMTFYQYSSIGFAVIFLVLLAQRGKSMTAVTSERLP